MKTKAVKILLALLLLAMVTEISVPFFVTNQQTHLLMADCEEKEKKADELTDESEECKDKLQAQIVQLHINSNSNSYLLSEHFVHQQSYYSLPEIPPEKA